jgi:polar amino acid transport system substrate-binding protein
MLRVGTSADYAPFEYYDLDAVSPQFDGFDIALIKEVGTRLGVAVEITDFAFEGLGAALQIGQVDSAIAALSVTEDRLAEFDFSNVYYSGVGVALADEESDIGAVDGPEDMAGLRIGVQKSSVYETWAQDELVATGLISEDQLFAYAKPEHAVNDLMLDRLDLVLMDNQPAKEYVDTGGVRLVGEGVNPQVYAIAVPKGAAELQSQVNQALTDMQNDGTTSRLAMEYMGVPITPEELPPPAPTSAPGPTATPSGCVYGMAYVADLSYPDGTKVEAGTRFEKKWRILNSGTCTWDETDSLRFVRGDKMGGKSVFIKGDVKPGETYDIAVKLTAPGNPGKYTGFWQMHTAFDVPFGETIWVSIQSVSSSGATATSAPVPTATSVLPTEEPPTAVPPTAETCVINSMVANPSTVKVGGNLAVSWSWTCSSVAKTSLTRTDPDGTVVPLYGGGDVPGNPGTYDDIAAKVGTLTYTLKVDSEFGPSATQSVTVTVTE